MRGTSDFDARYAEHEDDPDEVIERRFAVALARIRQQGGTEEDAWAQRDAPFGSRMEDHAPAKSEWIRYTDVRQANAKCNPKAVKAARRSWIGRGRAPF